MTGEQIYQAAVKALNDKKAEDIQVMKIGDLTIVADYFVIATGTSSTHVKSLADNVEYELGFRACSPAISRGRPPAGSSSTTAAWLSTCSWPICAAITIWSACGRTRPRWIFRI